MSDLIKKWEGRKLQAYLCPAGIWTIGWGHTGPDVKPGLKITVARAEELLRQDVEKFQTAILKLVKVPLTDYQLEALTSLVFNIGIGAFKSSTVLKRLNAGNYEGAGQAILMWDKAKNPKTGKKEALRGLTLRRKDELAVWNGAHLHVSMAQKLAQVEMPQRVAADEPHVIRASTDVWGGVTGAVSTAGGALAFAGDLHPAAQVALILVVGAALAIGGYVLWKRNHAVIEGIE